MESDVEAGTAHRRYGAPPGWRSAPGGERRHGEAARHALGHDLRAVPGLIVLQALEEGEQACPLGLAEGDSPREDGREACPPQGFGSRVGGCAGGGGRWFGGRCEMAGERLLEAFHGAAMEIGRGERDIAQRRRAEAIEVARDAGRLIAAAVVAALVDAGADLGHGERVKLEVAEERAAVAGNAAALAVEEQRAFLRRPADGAGIAREIAVPRRLAGDESRGLKVADGIGEVAHSDSPEQRLGVGPADEPAVGDLPVRERHTGLPEQPAHKRVVNRDEALRLELVETGRRLRDLVGPVAVAAGEVGRRAVVREAQHLLLAGEREERLCGEHALDPVRQVIAHRGLEPAHRRLDLAHPPVPEHVADAGVPAVPQVHGVARVYPLFAARAAVFREARRVHADRERHPVRCAASQQVAGGAGHVPRAAEDGVEEQHLPQAELGRGHQGRRLQRLEPARGDDAGERRVERLLARMHRRSHRTGQAKPQTQPKRPHDGSPSPPQFGLAAELNPHFLPGSWSARPRDRGLATPRFSELPY